MSSFLCKCAHIITMQAGQTLLHVASVHGKEDAVVHLLERDIDFMIQDEVRYKNYVS